MMNKKMKKIGAAALSACLLMAGGAAAGNMSVLAGAEEADEKEDGKVSLSLADGVEAPEEADDAAQEETEAQTEEQTEAPVNYDPLESTNTDDAAISTVDVSDIVKATMPSIVSITMESVQEVQNMFYGGTQEYTVEGAGSGIIIAQNDDELLIATNNHIVEDSQNLTVCFSVEAENEEDLVVPAVVKGTNSAHDLAVVAVKLSDIPEEVYKQLKIATLGSSDDLEVGDAAIVIGNALGIGQTVTTGIISALEREITTEEGTFTELQTDAAINFGCSGGAILNGKGEVIGITDAKATADEAESMGYGIPVSTAIPILQELINRETRETVEDHGYLGITVVPVSDEAKTMYNMPAGAFVYEVTEGSAADEAGIKSGDIVTEFDGIEITSSDELVETINYYNVGETVDVTLQVSTDDGYAEKEVEVTLQGAPEGTEEADADAESNDDAQQDDSQDGQSDVADPQQDDSSEQGGFQFPFNFGF